MFRRSMSTENTVTFDPADFSTPENRAAHAETTPFTDQTIWDFTQGDCWRLAHEVARRGWGRPVFVAYASDHDMWSHVAVEIAQGLFLDVRGVYSEEEMIYTYAHRDDEEYALVAAHGEVTYFRYTHDQHELAFEHVTDADVSRTADQLLAWVGLPSHATGDQIVPSSLHPDAPKPQPAVLTTII